MKLCGILGFFKGLSDQKQKNVENTMPIFPEIDKKNSKKAIIDLVNIGGRTDSVSITYEKPKQEALVIKTDSNKIEEISRNISKIRLQTQKLDKLDASAKKAVFVLGGAGAGKSMFLNYLKETPLKGIDVYGETLLVPKDEVYTTKDKGSSSNASLPQKWINENDDVVFWDCPSFESDENVIADAVHSECIAKVVGGAQSMKMILMLSYSDTKGKANKLIDFTDQLDKLFHGNISNHENSCMLVVSKVPIKASAENIKRRLLKMTSESSISESKQEFIKKIVDKIVIFNEPEVDKEFSDINRKLVFEMLDKVAYTEGNVNVYVAPSYKAVTEMINWHIELSSYMNHNFEECLKGLKKNIAKITDEEILKTVVEKINAFNREINSEEKQNNVDAYLNEIQAIHSLLASSDTSKDKDTDLMCANIQGASFLEKYISKDYTCHKEENLISACKRYLNNIKNAVDSRLYVNNNSQWYI